jgi:hypothetical protein
MIQGLLTADPPRELEQMAWLHGTWLESGTAYATPTTPERVHEAHSTLIWKPVFQDHWLMAMDHADAEKARGVNYLTYDALTQQWIWVTIEVGVITLGVRTARAWDGNVLTFTSTIRILDEVTDLRSHLIKLSEDAWKVVNEEKRPDGTWLPIDEHRFTRVPQG